MLRSCASGKLDHRPAVSAGAHLDEPERLEQAQCLSHCPATNAEALRQLFSDGRVVPGLALLEMI